MLLYQPEAACFLMNLKRKVSPVKSFEELFEKQIDCASLSDAVRKGEVRAIEVERERRFLEITVFFPQPVEREQLFQAEKLLLDSPLQVGRAVIRPRFPEESFSADYFPSQPQS